MFPVFPSLSGFVVVCRIAESSSNAAASAIKALGKSSSTSLFLLYQQTKLMLFLISQSEPNVRSPN